MELKNNIKKVIDEKGVSIREISKMLDMSYSNTHLLVNKEYIDKTHFITMLKIAEYLDVTVSELYVRNH